MKKRNIIRHLVLLGLLLPVLASCSASRSQIGAVAGGTSGVAGCVAVGVSDPYVTGACALIGAFAGAEIMYKSDYDVHNAVFVDHLDNSPHGQSYTNWYNQQTGNSGIIKTTSSYTKGPIMCRDYNATVDIKQRWPLVGIGGLKREVIHGTACMLPDGRWVEMPR